MKNVITSVMPDSIAEEVGIEENDILLSVNGEKIVDIIDYRFLTNDEEIVLEIQKPNGEIWDYEIEKDYGEELGLEFGGGIMDKAKRCSNKCMFCFIDQNPKHVYQKQISVRKVTVIGQLHRICIFCQDCFAGNIFHADLRPGIRSDQQDIEYHV